MSSEKMVLFKEGLNETVSVTFAGFRWMVSFQSQGGHLGVFLLPEYEHIGVKCMHKVEFTVAGHGRRCSFTKVSDSCSPLH